MQEKRALGKGLSSLIPMGKSSESTSKNYIEAPIEDIIPNKDQPRKLFDKASIDELANSIEEKGIIQPLLVRKMGGGKYELIAGERRLRAAKQARLIRVPVIIKDVEDTEVLELALIENIQRENLNPVEEALAYKELINKYQYTQDELAKRLGKERSTITNFLRLLKLPDSIRQHIISSTLSMGHARALITIENKELLETICKQIIDKGLSVRDVENLIRDLKDDMPAEVTQINAAARAQNNKKENMFRNVEELLKNQLKTKVQVKGNSNRGKLTVHFHSEDELNKLIDKLSN
ncbi:MAG: hypothetical protein ACD_73C00792G0008 [uncultured bacterium]|nr:MAG: hypothetical protein ACD_73C00792G0008 [uncultured bacterium]